MAVTKDAYDFLTEKFGYFNKNHPISVLAYSNGSEPDIEDIIECMEEYKNQSQEQPQPEIYYGKEFGTQFEQIVYWATHSGWRYCQGREGQCGNELILKMDHFNSMVKHILKTENAINQSQEQPKVIQYLKSEYDLQIIKMKALGIVTESQTFEQCVNAVIYMAGGLKGNDF